MFRFAAKFNRINCKEWTSCLPFAVQKKRRVYNTVLKEWLEIVCDVSNIKWEYFVNFKSLNRIKIRIFLIYCLQYSMGLEFV
jgi:hypothetical protein